MLEPVTLIQLPENMLNLVKNLLGRKYHFLNTIKISRSKLINNYRYLSSLNKGLKIVPVLKSNAYGHGIVQVGKILNQLDPEFLCVDSLHEAYRLQNSGINSPILVMGYINPENLKIKKLPFSYAVYSLDYLKKIHQYQPQAGIHLKVDTGMHRMGIPIPELEDLLIKIKDLKGLKVEGLMSHLATTKDPLFTIQLNNFQQASRLLDKHGIQVRYKHLGASEAILNPKVRSQISKASNIVRAGKAFYGYSTTVDDTHLRPALTLTTTIAQIKKLTRGDLVGYDGTFKVNKNLVMAVLPIGYFDGVDRRLSNRGVVLVNNIVCPIIGRVSMNITTVDISKVNDPQVNQRVVIISDNPKDPNSVGVIAKLCDTIPHEILVHLADSTTRIVE